jgi:hypothetical protein
MHPGWQQSGDPAEEIRHCLGLWISKTVKWYTTRLKYLILNKYLNIH